MLSTVKTCYMVAQYPTTAHTMHLFPVYTLQYWGRWTELWSCFMHSFRNIGWVSPSTRGSHSKWFVSTSLSERRRNLGSRYERLFMDRKDCHPCSHCTGQTHSLIQFQGSWAMRSSCMIWNKRGEATELNKMQSVNDSLAIILVSWEGSICLTQGKGLHWWVFVYSHT